MFLGHNAVGLAAKRLAPAASLGTLFLATQLPDLVWPVLLLTGVEKVSPIRGGSGFASLNFASYPYSHSLVGCAALGLVLAALYWGFAREKSRRTALALFVGVVSHWVLDLVVHRPDLPIVPGGSRYGFGLWDHPAITVALELGLFAAGLAVYVRTTRPNTRVGTWSLASFAVLLVAIYAGNVVAPAPESWQSVAWLGLSAWLLVAWGYWIDANRHSVRIDPATGVAVRVGSNDTVVTDHPNVKML